MKRLVLDRNQMSLLRKVSSAGYSFYDSVNNFLEVNEDLPEGETAELVLEDEDEFDDVYNMVEGYLGSGRLGGKDKPTDQERIKLQKLAEQLTHVLPEEQAGDTEDEPGKAEGETEEE